VFHLRCTKKLLKRIGAAPEDAPGAATTLLGDWYANIVFSKPQQLVVCISERTLLPVVVPARNVHGLHRRLCAQLEELLQIIGVPSVEIAHELAQMHEHRFAPTASKSALGSLNEAIFQLSWSLSGYPDRSLLEHAIRLAEIPNKPIGYAVAAEATHSLFRAKQVIAAASGVS
jgi:hypothetical protein